MEEEETVVRTIAYSTQFPNDSIDPLFLEPEMYDRVEVFDVDTEHEEVLWIFKWI